MNLIGHLAVHDHLVFVVAHLVELFVSELALALRADKGDLWLAQEDGGLLVVLDLFDEAFLRQICLDFLGSPLVLLI